MQSANLQIRKSFSYPNCFKIIYYLCKNKNKRFSQPEIFATASFGARDIYTGRQSIESLQKERSQ